MIVYRVYDTLNSEYWASFEGKTVFHSSGAAKNAWNTYQKLRFNDPNQTRFIIHQFELKRILEEVK